MYNNTIVEVETISIEHTEELVDVYNFEVENAHTYYVTDKGVLVHNKCGTPKKPKRVSDKSLKGKAHALKEQTLKDPI